MSELYDELCKQFQDGELTAEDLDPVEDWPYNFGPRVNEVNSGDRAFDAFVMRQFLMDRASRADEAIPKNVATLKRRSLEPDRPEFYEPQREYLDRCHELHGRAWAFRHGLRKSLLKRNHQLLQHTLDELSADERETFVREAYEIATYETPGGVYLKTARAENLSPAAKTHAPFLDRKDGNEVRRAPLGRANAGRIAESELTKLYTTFLQAVPFDDQQLSSFIDACFENVRAFLSHDQAIRAFLKAAQTLHDGETLRDGTELDETFDSLAKIQERFHGMVEQNDERQRRRSNTDFDPVAFNRAMKGLSGDHDELEPLYRTRDFESYRRWHDQGGSIRVYEVRHCATKTFDDERFVEFALKHYDADQGQLNDVLRRAVRSIAQTDPTQYETPFASIEALIDAGADPKQTDPTLLQVFLEAVYTDRSDGRLSGFEEGLNYIQEQSAKPRDLTDLREAYWPENLPDVGQRIDRALNPLIRYGVYPTDEQLSALEQKRPEVYDVLFEQLPARKRKAEQSRQQQTR